MTSSRWGALWVRRSLPGGGESGSCVQRFRGRGCSRVPGVLQPARRGAASGHPGPRPPGVPWPRGTLMSVSCCPSDVGCVPSPGNGQDVPSSRPTAGRLPGEPAALGPSMSSPIAGSGAFSSPHPAGQRGQSRLSPTLTGVGRGSCHRNLPDLGQLSARMLRRAWKGQGDSANPRGGLGLRRESPRWEESGHRR